MKITSTLVLLIKFYSVFIVAFLSIKNRQRPQNSSEEPITNFRE